MPEERLTLCLAGHVYFTKGKHSETIPAEMETADIRRVLTRLAEYENACFDDECVEVVDTHAIHVMRGNKTEFPRHDWTPCAERLPEETGKYWVTFFYYGAAFAEKRDYFAHEKRWGQGGKPVAWMCTEANPEPYNPDRIRDTTEMMQEETA